MSRLETLELLQGSLWTEIMLKMFLFVLNEIWENDEEQDKSKMDELEESRGGAEIAILAPSNSTSLFDFVASQEASRVHLSSSLFVCAVWFRHFARDLPVLKNVLAAANVLSAKWKKQTTLIYVTAYDVLFGQKIGMTGAAEKLLILHKDALESALSKLCTRKAVKCIEELLLDNQNHVLPKPRYVRVNTLKINTETAIQELERIAKVKIDDVVPDMLVLPGGTDLHNHRLVLDGSIFLQLPSNKHLSAFHLLGLDSIAVTPLLGSRNHVRGVAFRGSLATGFEQDLRDLRDLAEEACERVKVTFAAFELPIVASDQNVVTSSSNLQIRNLLGTATPLDCDSSIYGDSSLARDGDSSLTRMNETHGIRAISCACPYERVGQQP
ncbi:putative methyltransferase [Dendrobium catenatum]|uniref:Putative methyltransferase n=1 Tax=Dendrobium catenatum TaxID=906689 RepID=A0A2I0X6S3_9ASPA|nr:putative methyltransferase [Dendrobium catenatum]